LRVIALNPEEGWSQDVSEEIAKAVLAAASDRRGAAFVQAQRLRNDDAQA
jgi:hypothetical protein